MPKKLRLVLLSDTHGYHNEVVVPDGDVLIHAGDYSAQGTFRDLVAFNVWLGRQPHKHKLVISGNHDQYADTVNTEVVQEFMSNATYLENTGAYIEGKTFWGSPITPQFGHWSFMKSRGNAISMVWQMIPHQVDVLITHGPAQGILDKNANHELCGCYDLGRYIREKQVGLHVFGHIHEGYGNKTLDNVQHINCSVLNDRYELVNKPVVIDI